MIGGSNGDQSNLKKINISNCGGRKKKTNGKQKDMYKNVDLSALN